MMIIFSPLNMSTLKMLLVLLSSFSPLILSLELPASMHKCRLRDPKLNECIIENGNYAIPFLKTEDKLHHVPSFDPLSIEKIVSQPTENFRIELTNSKSYGFIHSTLKNASFDLDKKIWSFHFFVPRWEMISDYKLNGRILVLNIRGNGPCNMTLVNMDLYFTATFELKTGKDGKVYMNFLDEKTWFTTKKVYIKLDNLFGGDRRVGDEVNRMFNENWSIVNEEFTPAITETISTVATATFNGLFSVVPYENIFDLD